MINDGLALRKGGNKASLFLDNLSSNRWHKEPYARKPGLSRRGRVGTV